MDTVPEQLYLLQNEEQTGPFPSETIGQMLQLGTILPGDFVWADGMPEWVTVESLFGQLPVAGSAPTTPKKRRRPGARPTAASFAKFIGDATAYPFRGYGWITLLMGTFVLTGIQWFKLLPASPFLLNLLLSLSAWGYVLLMLQKVIHRTAFGESDLPEWPDFDGFGELIGKCLQWFIVLLVCFGPAIYIGTKLSPEEGEEAGMVVQVIFWLALVVGAGYFPMALLGVAMYDTVGALNPLLVVRSIGKVPGHYMATLLVFGLLLGLKAVTSNYSDLIPVLGTMLDHLDSLWSSVFLARVLGGLYAINRDKLAWF